MIGSLLSRQKLQRPMSAPSPDPLGYYAGQAIAWEGESRKEYVRAYVDRVWVQRCVNLIVNSSVSVPVQAKMRGEVIEDHRVNALLDAPNPRDPASTFVGSVTFWAQVVGDWFAEALPNQAGEPAALYPMRSHLVRIRPGVVIPKGYVYDKDENGDAITLDAAQPGQRLKPNTVIAGRLANPLDDWYGMPPLRGAKDDVISEYYGVRYDHRFFQNSARPDTVVAFKDKLDDESRKKNREAWQSFKGVDNAHKAVVMDGDPRVTTLSNSPKDMEYHAGRLLSREGQCAAFGVPPVLVGDMQKATYSNFKEAEPIFWKETMVPWLDFLGKWMTAALVPFYDDIDELCFDTSGVEALQESEDAKITRLASGVSGSIYTPNEAREAIDLEAVEDEAADQLHMAQNVVPITGKPIEPVTRPPAQVPDDVPVKTKAGETLDLDGLAAVQSRYVVNRYTELESATVLVADQLAQIFEAQYLAIALAVGGKSKAIDIEKALEDYDWNGDQAKIIEVIEAMHGALTTRSIAAMKDILGVDVGFTGDSTRVQTMLKELINRPDGISTVQGRVKDDVVEEVRKGIANGIPNRGIATGGTFDIGPPGDRQAEQVTLKGVKGVYQEYKTWQAERIARTEGVAAYNGASAAVMREAGIEFVDILDGDGDAECAEANGSRWPLALYEQNPYAHPNCTRVGLPVLPEAVNVEDLAQLARGGIVPKGAGPFLRGPESLATHVHLESKTAPVPTIHIHNPDLPEATVNVEPTPISVTVEGKGSRRITFERDDNGFVTGAVEEPTDDA